MINSQTLTCTHCGGSGFIRVAPNEYRCNRCESVTLVEDDVAARLEQLLLSMQPMQPPSRELNRLLIAAALVGTAALLFAVFVVFAG